MRFVITRTLTLERLPQIRDQMPESSRSGPFSMILTFRFTTVPLAVLFRLEIHRVVTVYFRRLRGKSIPGSSNYRITYCD